MKKTFLIALIVFAILLSGCVEPPEPTGKCGDGTCDPREIANPNLCPQDCEQPPIPTICGDGTCAGYETFENCSQDCEQTQNEETVGFIACSITHNAVDGYIALGGTNFWTWDQRHPNSFGGAGIITYYRQLMDGVGEGEKDYWELFKTQAAAHPETEKIWLETCANEASKELTYENLLAIKNEIKRIAPNAELYVTPMPIFVDTVDKMCVNKEALETINRHVKRMVREENDVKSGPKMTNLTEEVTKEDGCHATEAGQAIWGQDLMDFFDEGNSRELELKQAIAETNVTPGNGKYKRVELIVVGNELWFGFEVGGKFKLVELNEDLSYKGPVYEIFSGPNERDPHDIRLATDGTNLWYAFETVISDKINTCDGHFLNIAKYDISGNEPRLESSKIDIAKGCPFSNAPPNLSTPVNPELVDDPSPIFYNGEYVVLTRAWWDHTVHHIRTFDKEFNQLRDLTLDLGPLTNNKTLTQNALVNIDGKIYIIGGLASNPATSGIYAIPLSSDLTSVEGEIVSLINEPTGSSKKTTAARYVDGKLYINYVRVVSGGNLQHLGVFDVENDFAPLIEIQFQDEGFQFNHSSIEVFENRIYALYNEGEISLPFDILGQVFEWQ